MIVVFLCYNLCWYGWRSIKYKKYTERLDVFIEDRSYVLTGEDGYLYNVKMPDYLSYTGNLAVAVPNGDYAMIIWPKAFSGYRFGVQLLIEEEIYEIWLEEDLSARDDRFHEIVMEYKDVIHELFEKADAMWGILE